MAEKLQVRVVTPEKPVFEGEADAVVVPAHDGEVGILPRHARFLASLGVGELRITSAKGVQRFFIENGFVQVAGDRVTVLCERSQRLEELNVAGAEAEALAARGDRTADATRLQHRASVMRRVAAHTGSPHRAS